MEKSIRIAVARDWAGWYEKFTHALEAYQGQAQGLSYSIVDLDRADWQNQIAAFDIIVWDPHVMGINLASHLKEKIYFLQFILQKKVFPNFNTVWHYESKVAQSILFNQYRIKTPPTFVTFNYAEACQELEKVSYPVVLKKSAGASSENVQLIKNKRQLSQHLENSFCDQLWGRERPGTSKLQFIIKNWNKRWFWLWILRRYGVWQGGEGVIYWQEYITGNQADLRITVIGDRFAYGFWRNNRPDDFRASGSGLFDYGRPIPEEVLKYCIQLNKDLGFDSMCYDILFTADSFVITEMSYDYIDTALFNAYGYFESSPNDNVEFRQGHTWPQELWVKWMLLKLGYLQ